MRAIDSFNNLLVLNWSHCDWFSPVCSQRKEIKQWTNIAQDKAVEHIYQKLCINGNYIGIEFEKIDPYLIKQSIKLAFSIKNGKKLTKTDCPSFEEFLISCLFLLDLSMMDLAAMQCLYLLSEFFFTI